MIDYEQEFEISAVAAIKAAMPNSLVDRFYGEPDESGFMDTIAAKLDLANRGSITTRNGVVLVQCSSGTAEGIDSIGKLYRAVTTFTAYCASKTPKENQLKGGKQAFNLMAQVRAAVLAWNGTPNFSDGQPINPEFVGWQRLLRSETLEIVAVQFTFEYTSEV